MNKFKNFKQINEADADEYVIDDDDFEQELTPNSKSEIEFVDLHKAVTIAHPVAGENQFKSDKDHAVTTGAESDNAEGEDKPIKQGTSGDSNFARFRNKISKAPARKGDKSQGDMKAETVKEEVELEESKYDLYHRDFSSAMQHAYKMAKKLYGITVDPEEIDNKVATGPRKPSEGKTNKYRLEGDKGAIQVQVYNKGGSKPFELNMYKEEVELDEALSPKDMAAVQKYVDTFLSRLPKDLKVKVMKNPKVAAKILADVATKGKLLEEVELDERVAAFNKDGEAVAMYRDIATAKKLKPGHLYMHIKTNDKNDDDESDYKAGAFSYGKAGYRAKVMNKEGKIVYIGSASYKSIDKAKGEAKEYAKSFAKNGKDQKMAINAVANYRKRNKPSIYELYKETEQLQEHYAIEEVISESVKPGAMKLKDGKTVKISDSDAKIFNDVMKKLNPENRKRMEAEMMKDQKSFKQMLSFVRSQD